MLILETVRCEQCDADIETFGERAERVQYCSQGCARKDRVLSVGNCSADSTVGWSVAVSTADRRALKKILLGETHDATLSALAGLWRGRKERPPRKLVDAAPRESRVTVSESTHELLCVLRDDMHSICTLGETVSVLVANHRRW